MLKHLNLLTLFVVIVGGKVGQVSQPSLTPEILPRRGRKTMNNCGRLIAVEGRGGAWLLLNKALIYYSKNFNYRKVVARVAASSVVMLI